MINLNDKINLALLKEGSSKAFEKLFDQYAGKLYNFILKLSSGDTYLAEEIVQRTFIKIWEIRTQINPQKSFISYLCTIAKNMLMNEYEHMTVKFAYKEYILKYHQINENIIEKEIDRNLLEEYIDKLTDELPPARRQIFILSRKEHLSNKEIAERLQISESTIQTQLSKALIFMKEHLSKYYDIIILLVIYNFVNFK